MKYLLFTITAGLISSASLLAQSPSTPPPGQGISLPARLPASVPNHVQGGMEAAAEMLKNFINSTNLPFAGVGKPAEPRELMALLPAEILELRRTSIKGEKSGLLGANVVFAHGTYGVETGPQFVVKIADLAALGPLGAVTGLGLMSSEIESEGDEGYERTNQYQGHKGVEKYSTASKSGTAKIMINNRFLVEIEGKNIEPQQLKSAIAGVNLDPLTQMFQASKSP